MTDIFKLSTKELSKAGVKMVLIDPRTDEPLTAPHKPEGSDEPVDREMFITLLGPDSSEMRRLSKQIMKRVNAEKKTKKKLTEEQIAKDIESDARFYSKLTVTGCVFAEGKWVEGEEFTKEFAFEVFRDVSIARAQAQEFINSPENFISGNDSD